MNTSTRRLTWGLAAAAVLATCTLAAVAPANAATQHTGIVAAAVAGPSNIDTTKQGSLTIHKYAQPTLPTGALNDGTALDPSVLAGLTPLKGVQFSVQQVTNIDLSTNAGWALANGLTAATVLGNPGTYTLGTSGLLSTDVNGNASVGSLPLGVYLVEEVGTGGNPITNKTAPFLVSIPMPQNGSSSWLYDVNVYPKNSVTTLGKSVDDSKAVGIGDHVKWDITAAIPHEEVGKSISKFKITDPIDSRLSLDSATVTVTDASGAAVALVPADYTITPAAPAASPVGDVVLTFTSSGLAKLTANQGGTVKLSIGTTVQSLGADGVIADQATVSIDDFGGTTPKVDVKFGALQITKVAQNDPTKTLQGASYQVFASLADAQAKTNPITTGGSNTFTTDASGQVTVPGLKVQDGQTSTDYWIVETQAPVGYQIDNTPIKVTITPSGLANAAQQTVSDAQIPAFMLPLTGSTGTAIFTALGGTVLLSATAIAVVTVKRRRRAEVATADAAE